METRIEKDFLGEVEVPKDAYYGIFTVRAMNNFKISGRRAPKIFIYSLAFLKKACAMANVKLKVLDEKIGSAIITAAQEVMNGEHDDQFPLDIYQAGAGTPYNMNMNEVLTNRALELLNYEKGRYDIISPNNHANASQSSNDVIPTATRIALALELQKLKSSLNDLEKSLRKKGEEFAEIVKVGRTHYQDAVPITLGQEFFAYAHKIHSVLKMLEEAEEKIKELGIGGTAIGTGINTHPAFSEEVVSILNKETYLGFYTAENKIDKTQNFDDFVFLSNVFRTLAISLLKISNDLKLLNSGPNCGIAEIVLPAVEPGSSIMPGKVNPSVLECVDMVCYEVIGRDQAVLWASANGVLELNVNAPLIMWDLLDSLNILSEAVKMFRVDCIEGIVPNKAKLKEYVEKSLIIATALNPVLGYHKVAELVKEAQAKNKTIREVIIEHNILSSEELDRLLDPKKLTEPNLK